MCIRDRPRYHLEMALLRWIYLRKLVPIEELIAGTESGPGSTSQQKPAMPQSGSSRPEARIPQQKLVDAMSRAQRVTSTSPGGPGAPKPPGGADVVSGSSRTFKDDFLAEIKKSKVVF